MGLFINCQSSYEVQLLYLSLNIEVLSFEDSEWRCGRCKMDCQVKKLEGFRHILLFESNRGAKTAEAARNICAVYGDSAIGDSTARKWFYSFKEDLFDISDTPGSGRPSEFDEDCLNTLIHNDPCQCTRKLANVMH